MNDWKNKVRPSKIGRRTGTDILQGKSIRIRDDGTEMFDDYWTDGDSVHSDQTTHSLSSPIKNRSEPISRNVSSLNSAAVSPVKLLSSSFNKNLNQRREEYNDRGGDSSPEQSRSSGLSKNKSLQLNLENATIVKSKMVQTSHLLDETESSPSKDRTQSIEIEINNDGLFECKKSLTKSSRVLSNTSPKNRMKDFLSADDTNAASVLLSHEREYGKTPKEENTSNGYETEGSPSKNGAYIPASHLRETGGKKADLPDNERNLTTRRSLRVLSSTLSPPNSKEKEKQMNFSGGKSPQRAAKSSEMLKLKENVPSRSDKSVNKSEILVPNQKESNKKKGKRKCSIGKSPIAVKRNKQARAKTNALENRLCKTSNIQNIEDYSSKRNSLGRTSSQHAAKCSEDLNQKETIPSRSDKNVNTSVSSEKENEQNSFIEKSPRASEHKVMQVSNNTDLQRKDVSPIHSVRRKILFSETAKDVPQRKKQPPCGVRRSSRMRFPPLASWRNERPKFKKSVSGEIIYLGIDKGTPEDDFGIRCIAKTQKKIEPKISKKKPKIIKNLIAKTKSSGMNTGKIYELHLHRPFSKCEWILPDNVESPGYMISHVFTSRMVTFGFLDIASHCIKEKRFSPDDTTHFVVVKGVVDAVIDTNSFTLYRGDSFMVPPSTMYCISNNTSSSALLHYCVFKKEFISSSA